MYGQNPNPIVSAAKWIFYGFVGAVLMALLLGANVRDATWLNPQIASAQARRIDIDTDYQSAVNGLQIQLTQAKTNAEIQKIQREQELLDAKYSHDIQALNQDLEHSDIAFKTWMTLITFFGDAVSIALMVIAVLWGGSKAMANMRPIPFKSNIQPVENIVHPVAEEEPYDPWMSPAYRYQQRMAAQRTEYKQRAAEIAMRMKSFKDPTQMSEEEYKKRPLAG